MLVRQLARHLRTIQNCSRASQRSDFSTAACLCGRASRNPYDIRWPIFPKKVGPHTPGGSLKLASEIGLREDFPQLPGYRDERGKFHLVREMIPEFVVPDLRDFKLKPYVSYRVKEIKQSEFTAEDLFNACYAQDIVDKLKEGEEVTNEDLDKVHTKSGSGTS